MVCTKVPLVPATVIVWVPAIAEVCAVKLKVVDPDAVTDRGLNFPVTCAGRPLRLKVVTPTKPSAGVSVTVTWPLGPPRVIVIAPADAAIEKSPGEFTRSLRGAVRVSVPAVPVTVIV